MRSNFTKIRQFLGWFFKIRQFLGWFLIIVSIILSLVAFLVAYIDGCFAGGWSGFSWSTCGKGLGTYVASQVAWYPGIALLGPEVVQKSKDMWNNLKQKVIGFFK